MKSACKLYPIHAGGGRVTVFVAMFFSHILFLILQNSVNERDDDENILL